MKKTKDMTKTKKVSDNLDRLKEANKDYKKLKEEIAPFLKKRVREVYTTAGKWMDSSCVSFQQES